MTKEEAIDILMDDEYLLYEDDSPYNREAYDMAIEALQAQATLDDVSNAYENGYKQGKFEALQWIPCSERLPNKYSEYLVTATVYREPEVFIDEYYGDGIWNEYGRKMTAWMPLPSPYKGDKS